MPFPSTIQMSTFITIRFKRLQQKKKLKQPADAVLQECVVDINLPSCGSAEVVIVFMWVRGGAGFYKYSSFQTDPQPSEGDDPHGDCTKTAL